VVSAERLDSDTRRQQIAAAALEVVSTRGMRGLSMAAVARRVGVVPSALYRHFRNKEELLDAILDLLDRRLQATLQAARASSPDSLRALHEALIRQLGTIRRNQAFPRLVFSEDFHDSAPGRKARVLAIIRAYLTGVADLVREGQREGSIRRDLEPEALAVMFLGLVQPGAVLWFLSDGGFDVTRHAEKGWQLFSEVIGAAAAPKAGAKRRSRTRRTR
jgi:AcrR family transcriptional regulator